MGLHKRASPSQNNINSNQTTMDLNEVDEGIYNLRITDEDGKVYSSGIVISKVK